MDCHCDHGYVCESCRNIPQLAALEARAIAAETERDAALDGARVQREVAENYLSHCEAACKQVDDLEEKLLAAEKDRDALAALAEERRVALETTVSEVRTIAYGKEEEVKNEFSSGESHGWGMAHLHICGIIGPALSATQSSALPDLERRVRVACLRDLTDGLLFFVDADVKQMIRMHADQIEAGMATQPPAEGAGDGR
jgi:hypothetical protein